MPIQNNTDVQKAMDSLDHDLLTGETLDVGDKLRVGSHKSRPPASSRCKIVRPYTEQARNRSGSGQETTNNQLFIVA